MITRLLLVGRLEGGGLTDTTLFVPIPMAATTVSFQFRAWLIGTGDAPWDAILRWYRDMAADFLDEMPDLNVEHVGRGVFRGTFRRTDEMPVNPCWSIEAFVDPDEDGNWPLACGRASYIVRGELDSIDGVPVVRD